MRLYASWLSLLTLTSCGGASVPAPETPVVQQSALSQAKLGLFMRDNVNGPFSRLSFMIFHAEEEEEGEEAGQPTGDKGRKDGGVRPPSERAIELAHASTKLAESAKRLRAFSSLSAPTEEGRAVFDTYVENLVRETDGLVGFIAGGDMQATATALERITGTCNSCHHFYRLKDVETTK